jgi:glutathione peroxidase
MTNPSVMTVLFLLATALTSTVQAACPDFLNTEMRKLSSKERVNFCEAYAGKPLLIVNTASNCGYTKQFDGLEDLYQEYQDRGLVVIGFSSDDFFQEENDEGDVAAVCYEKYNVSFPMIATSAVRGSDVNPVFKGLGEAKGYPKWNFYKYLVSPEGEVIERFSSNVAPSDAKLRTQLDAVTASIQ